MIEFLKPLKRQIPSNSCTGCRSCEIVCSLHHTESFNPVKSSIQVTVSDAGGLTILLDATCDHCLACLRFCVRGVLNPEILGPEAPKGN
jgi:Fe-S-cluster-containing hydrogenase component 2